MRNCLNWFAVGLLGVAWISIAPLASADEKVKVGWVPAMVSSPLMIAKEKGYFTAAGIELELESVTTATDAMAHVGTNRMQVLEGGVQANFFNAIAAKYPIVIAGDRASTPLGHLVMIRPDLKDEIKSLKDLKGRTISLAGAGSIIAYEMDKLLQTAGLSLKDTTVKVMPIPQLPVAFANKVIDAADKRHIPAGSWFGKTEQQLRAIKQGARFICHSNDSSLLKDIMTTTFGALRAG